MISAAGTPLANTEVILVEKRITHRTFTNAKGEYMFLGNIDGPATVQAGGITQMIPQLQSVRMIELRLR